RIGRSSGTRSERSDKTGRVANRTTAGECPRMCPAQARIGRSSGTRSERSDKTGRAANRTTAGEKSPDVPGSGSNW
ncbi:MAG: hypothetical protein ACPG3X_04755, partial [Opitutales bacterium]